MLSVFLSFVLAMAMVPSIAFAAETDGADDAATVPAEDTVVQEEAVEQPEAEEPEAPAVETPEAEEPEVPAVEEEAPAAAEESEEAVEQPAANNVQKGRSAGANAKATYNLSGFTVTMANDGFVYTGSAIKPNVTIVDPDGIKLTKGVDYSLTYSNNIRKGKAKVTITMMGDYTGSAYVTYIIGGWKKYSGGWRFGYQSGNTFYCFQKQFATIGGKTYRFNASGFRLTGWQNINGYRYRFNTSGVMQKGLITVGDSKYYMNPTNGRLRTGWWTVNGKLRYFRPGTSPKGKMYTVTKSGVKTINGYKYYFINNGANDYAVKNAWYGGLYYGSNGRYTIVKPTVYAEFDSEYLNCHTNAVGFYLENNSKGGVMTIQDTGHMLDGVTSLELTDIVGGYFEDLSWQKVTAQDYGWVCLRTSDFEKVDFMDSSVITFKFKYDGVMWIGTVSSSGFSCERA